MAPSRHDWKIVDWDVKPQHNQPTNCSLESLLTYMKVKDINMNKIGVPKKWLSDSYKTSSQTPKPAVINIMRATLHNRSFCLFIFNFRYLPSILIFGELGRIKQHVHTFRPPKHSRLYHFSRNINDDVSCRSVNWPLVTPRHKWFRQNRTHLTTYLRLENKLKDYSIALHSHCSEFHTIKMNLYDEWQTYHSLTCLQPI